MALVGNYNPAGYVAGSFATYPVLPVGATLYQPSMWWNSTGTGTMDGHKVVPTDRIYAVGKSRNYGDLTYGAMEYGSPGVGDWSPSEVTWYIWSNAGKPPTWASTCTRSPAARSATTPPGGTSSSTRSTTTCPAHAPTARRTHRGTQYGDAANFYARMARALPVSRSP